MTRYSVVVFAGSILGLVAGFLLTSHNSRDSAPRTNRITENIRRRELEFAKQLPPRSERSEEERVSLPQT